METCKLHEQTVERMDKFFIDVAETIKNTAVLKTQIDDILKDQTQMEKRIDLHENRLLTLEKITTITEATIKDSLRSLERFGRALDKYSDKLEETNRKFTEMDKHVVVLTVKVGFIVSMIGAFATFLVNYIK